MRREVFVAVLLAAPLFGCLRPPESAGPPPVHQQQGAPVWPAPGSDAPPAEAEPYTAVLEDPADDEGDDVEVDDGHEEEPGSAQGAGAPPTAMFPSEAEVAERLAKDPASLGPMSIGLASGGALFNAVKMPEGERWRRLDPDRAWGTQETIDGLVRCIEAVNRRFPDTPKIDIGHISAKSGGKLSPHKSHQSGRDVDVGYYYKDGERRAFARATAANLDRERTWAFVRALITDTDVELILIDTAIQKLLKQHALEIGEDAAWLEEVFQAGSRSLRPIVKHARGHATHIHVRFISPVAQEMGRRAHPHLVSKKMVTRSVDAGYVLHRAKNGDTLGSLANRYGTTVKAIQQANGLRSTAIRAKVVYKIPTTRAGAGASSSTSETTLRRAPPVVVPPRRLPPA